MHQVILPKYYTISKNICLIGLPIFLLKNIYPFETQNGIKWIWNTKELKWRMRSITQPPLQNKKVIFSDKDAHFLIVHPVYVWKRQYNYVH